MEREEPNEQVQEQSAHCHFLFTWGEPSLIGREGTSSRPGRIDHIMSSVGATKPTKISGPLTVVSISQGQAHSAFVSKSGRVYTWGLNLAGRLGHGNEQKSFLPTLVQSSHLSPPTLKSNPPTVPLPKIKQISCGFFHSGALTTSGDLYTCGRGYKGFLGNHSQGNHRTFTKVAFKLSVVKVCCAKNHTLILTSNHQVYSFGFPKHGRLGHGDEHYYRLPKLIEKFKSLKIIDIATFGAHSLALDSTGRIWGWGSNLDGKLGLGDEINRSEPHMLPLLGEDPTQQAKGEKAKMISCGFDSSFAIGEISKKLYVWGNNEYGQLGVGDRDCKKILKAKKVDVGGIQEEIVCVRGGAGKSVGAIDSDGNLWMWGKNEKGQVGNGNVGTNQYEPVRVVFEEEKETRVVCADLAVGGEHTIAVVKLQK